MNLETPLGVASGYSAPHVTQFSVFLDNRVGRLLSLLQKFEEDESCHMCAFSVNEASDYAVVRFITNSAKDAKRILLSQSLPFSENELLVIELSEGHSLTRLCLYLLGAEINIRFAYPLMMRPHGQPTLAMAVDDLTLAGQILRKKHFTLLGEADLPNEHWD